LLCDDKDRSAQLYAVTMIGNLCGVELGYLNMGRIARAGGETRAQGLNLSLVGKTQVAPSLRVFGKVGTTYGRSETSALAASSIATGSEHGFGLSYGAGMSFDFTPRLSATLEWDSNDFRFSGGGRDPVRSTSLGLQFRY
jgi:OmpA-OmpF porin, OOP family